MIEKPKHNRKLVLGAVALTTQQYNRFDTRASNEVRDEIEKIIIKSGYVDHSPFSFVGLVIRYGLKTDKEPEIQRLGKKYGDLPLAIEIDVRETIDASLDTMKIIISRAVLRALIYAGEMYNCPIEELQTELDKLPEVSVLPEFEEIEPAND